MKSQRAATHVVDQASKTANIQTASIKIQTTDDGRPTRLMEMIIFGTQSAFLVELGFRVLRVFGLKYVVRSHWLRSYLRLATAAKCTVLK